MTAYRFAIVDPVPEKTMVIAENYDSALWKMAEKYGSGVMLYRLNLHDDRLYYRHC